MHEGEKLYNKFMPPPHKVTFPYQWKFFFGEPYVQSKNLEPLKNLHSAQGAVFVRHLQALHKQRMEKGRKGFDLQ